MGIRMIRWKLQLGWNGIIEVKDVNIEIKITSQDVF
jgi:hypothetical protein